MGLSESRRDSGEGGRRQAVGSQHHNEIAPGPQSHSAKLSPSASSPTGINFSGLLFSSTSPESPSSLKSRRQESEDRRQNSDPLHPKSLRGRRFRVPNAQICAQSAAFLETGRLFSDIFGVIPARRVFPVLLESRILNGLSPVSNPVILPAFLTHQPSSDPLFSSTSPESPSFLNRRNQESEVRSRNLDLPDHKSLGSLRLRRGHTRTALQSAALAEAEHLFSNTSRVIPAIGVFPAVLES